MHGGDQMTDDLKSLYGKYADFVIALYADLDRTAGQPVAPDYKTPLLSFDDFRRTWEAWGRTGGLQDVWRQRFEAGYVRAAAGLCARLESILGGAGNRINLPSRAAA
jgi:hypothetical protein